MKNRIKDYGRDFSSLDELLKDIQKRQEDLLANDELSLMAGLKGELKEGGDAILKALVYAKNSRRKPLCELLPSLDDYLLMLKGFDEAIKKAKDPETVNSFKCLEFIFRLDVMSLAGGTRGFNDEQMKYREDFFNRIKALPKDNLFRRAFVETFIDEEVFNRFYLESEKETGRYETDDEGENYTPEKALEWDAHYNALCDEYGEGEYKRHFTDENYREIERPHRKGRDALLLCHYPICYNRAKNNIELKETAKRHGVDEALINKVIQIFDSSLEDRLPQIEKEIDELERLEAGDTPTS